MFIGSGTEAAKNHASLWPAHPGEDCDECSGYRKWLDLVHGRDRRASRNPGRHEYQDREQGQRLSGVVAGSDWTPASSALDGGRSRPLPQSCAALLSRGDLTARPRCYVTTRAWTRFHIVSCYPEIELDLDLNDRRSPRGRRRSGCQSASSARMADR